MGPNMVMETTGTGSAIKARYLRGASLIAQQIDGTLWYYTHNAHGDVVQRTRHNGSATPQYQYDAFGNQREPAAKDPNPFRYCGEYWDAELGEVYVRARTYNPANGRFTSEDPARSGLNWYAYCNEDPLTRVDPSGLDSYILVDPEMFAFFGINGTVEETKTAFEEIYGTDTHVVYTTDSDYTGFENWWNGLPANGIDGVAVITHGNPQGITDRAGHSFISVDTIGSLSAKSIDTLFLYGCNTGDSYSANNLAMNFVPLVGSHGKVIAPDGVRFYSYIPFTGHTTWLKPSDSYRETSGYATYFYNALSHQTEFFYAPLSKPASSVWDVSNLIGELFKSSNQMYREMNLPYKPVPNSQGGNKKSSTIKTTNKNPAKNAYEGRGGRFTGGGFGNGFSGSGGGGGR